MNSHIYSYISKVLHFIYVPYILFIYVIDKLCLYISICTLEYLIWGKRKEKSIFLWMGELYNKYLVHYHDSFRKIHK